MKSARPASQACGVVLRRLLIPRRLLKVSLIAMTALHLAAPGARWAELPGTLLGLLPLLAGGLLFVTARRRVARAAASGAEGTVLVTGGPFRFSRHPMYLGQVLGLFGYAVLLGTLTPLLVVPATLLLFERGHVRREEAALADRFGPAWDDYRARTARWI